MKFFKNQKWLFLLVMLSLRTPEILSWGFDAEPTRARRSLTPDESESSIEMQDSKKALEEQEIQDRIKRIKEQDIWNDNRTAKSREIFNAHVENLVRNNPSAGDSDIIDKANTNTQAAISQDNPTQMSQDQDGLGDWVMVEKPKSKLQKVKDRARKSINEGLETISKLKNKFEDWLNSLSKQTSIEEAKQNITDQRNKKAEIFKNRGLDAIKKEVLENVTAQDLKQRAAKEVKQFEDQVGSLSSSAGDSVGVFAKRLQATIDIYTENAELLQKQYNQYGIPKIVVAGHPPKNLDPESYAFNIIDLGQKEIGSGQTFQEHLDSMIENNAIPITFDSEKIKEFNEKLFAEKPDTSIQNLKKEFLKIAYEMKVRQDLTLTTPEIIKQLVEYVIKKKAQIAEDAL